MVKPVVEERNIAKLFSVQGKVVLITGAGGLGGYLARGFAENGARVVVTDVVPGRAQGLQEKGFACRSYQLDQTDKAATEAVVQDIVKAEGRIDALINTAAIAPCHPAEEFPEDELRRVIDINLTAAVLTSQAVGRQMIAQQYGKIVNIGSIAGVMCHSYESMPYECTKAAVHQMTKSLACAWGCYNVNVNAIAPTWIMTPMLDDCPPEYFEAVDSMHEFGRMSRVEDFFGTAVYLVTDASNFISGHVLLVDGGWSTARPVQCKS
mgnify:FL=1